MFKAANIRIFLHSGLEFVDGVLVLFLGRLGLLLQLAFEGTSESAKLQRQGLLVPKRKQLPYIM